MLNFGRLEHLADGIGIEADQLRAVLDDFDENPESLVKELTVWPGDPSKKARNVISLRTPWRSIQERIYLKLLLPQLVPTAHSHGGVRGRSPASNARAHIGNTFALSLIHI